MTMAPKRWTTSLSSSGKVEYAITNHVAFLDKESVHADFHGLMDFLKNSPVNYALTATPVIYTEVVHEMWCTADCTTKEQIKFNIKGNSYIVTSSVINEALHLPTSNFETLPTDDEVISMLKCINYVSTPWKLSHVSRKYLRKEWSYFFDTLTRVFTGRCGGYNAITRFVQNIAYSLMYNKTVDIGALLLNEFSNKLGDIVDRSTVVYYARFFMIIANYLCKELSLDDRDDTLEVCVQGKGLFSHLCSNNFHAEVDYVLPHHVREQLFRLSSSPSLTSLSLVLFTSEDMREGSTPPTQVAVPAQSHSAITATSSVSRSGKRKKTTLPTIIEDGNGENETAAEVHPPQKKNVSEVTPARNLFVVDNDMPPEETWHIVPVEEPRRDLLFLLKPAQEPNDRQVLMNAASVLKSQLVARLTTYADKLRTEDMTILASKCYNALEELGDNYAAFSTEVNQLIAQHQELASAAEKKENWNEWDIKARYIHQVQCLTDVRQKLSSAQDKLSAANTNADFLKTEREELTSALLRLTQKLYEEEERVKTLKAERDQCKEAHSAIEAELGKLDAEKEEACVAFMAINVQYTTAKKEFERMSSHLLQLVKK